MFKKESILLIILIFALFFYISLPFIKEKVIINNVTESLIQLNTTYNNVIENYMNDEVDFDNYKKDVEKEYLTVKDTSIGNSDYTVNQLMTAFKNTYFEGDNEELLNILNSVPKKDINLLLEHLGVELQKAILVRYNDLDYDIYSDEFYNLEIDKTLKDLINIYEYVYSINFLNNKNGTINDIDSNGLIIYNFKIGDKDNQDSYYVSNIYENSYSTFEGYFRYFSQKFWLDLINSLEENEYYYLFREIVAVDQGNNHYKFDYISIIMIYEYNKILDDRNAQSDFDYTMKNLLNKLEIYL